MLDGAEMSLRMCKKIHISYFGLNTSFYEKQLILTKLSQSSSPNHPTQQSCLTLLENYRYLIAPLSTSSLWKQLNFDTPVVMADNDYDYLVFIGPR